MKVWKCKVCGYIHMGEEPPDECPLCKAKKSAFVLQGESGPAAAGTKMVKTVFADEHRVGIAKGLDPEVVQGLRENFNGECSEVGMYLAMSRQADREGYPEVAEAYRRIAFEEAEHAARFAELLGEVVHADTRLNLQLRVAAEAAATEGKLALAKRAMELDYIAIHDTVHEMCKDEARHGSVFEGLLNRYFNK